MEDKILLSRSVAIQGFVGRRPDLILFLERFPLNGLRRFKARKELQDSAEIGRVCCSSRENLKTRLTTVLWNLPPKSQLHEEIS